MQQPINLNGADCLRIDTEDATALVCRNDDDSYFTADCSPGTHGRLDGNIGIDQLDLTLVRAGGEVDTGAGCRFDLHDNSSGFF